MRSIPPLVPFFAAVLALASCTSTASNEPHAEPPSTQAEPARDLVVVPLQYAPAGEIADALNRSIDGRKVHVQPYERTNSLILTGSQADIATVQALIAKLDVQVKK